MSRGVRLAFMDNPVSEADRSQEEYNFYADSKQNESDFAQHVLNQTLSHEEIQDELGRLEQDKLNIADAIAVFTFAAYLARDAQSNTAFPDLGAAFQDLDIIDNDAITPRGIASLPNGRFSFNYDGVYSLSISGVMEHNSNNKGREFTIRLYNYDDSVASDGFVVGTWRDSIGTTISAGGLFEITEATKNKEFGFQVGGGDTYSAVNFQTITYYINAVSEWREPLG